MSTRNGFQQFMDDSKVYPAEARMDSPPPSYRPPSGGMVSPPPAYSSLAPMGTKVPAPSYEAPPLKKKTRPMTPVRTNTWERTPSELCFENQMYDQHSSQTCLNEPTRLTRSSRRTVRMRNRKPWIIAGVGLLIVAVAVGVTVGVILARSEDDDSEGSTTEVVAEFSVELHMQEKTWTDDLNNPSTDAFIDLATDVSMAMDETYQGSEIGDSYEGTEVESFSEGSVIAEINVKTKGEKMRDISKEKMEKVTSDNIGESKLGEHVSVRVKEVKTKVQTKSIAVTIYLHMAKEQYQNDYSSTTSDVYKKIAAKIRLMVSSTLKLSSLRRTLDSVNTGRISEATEGIDVAMVVKVTEQSTSSSKVVSIFNSENFDENTIACTSTGEGSTSKTSVLCRDKKEEKSKVTEYRLYVQFAEAKFVPSGTAVMKRVVEQHINKVFKEKKLQDGSNGCAVDDIRGCGETPFADISCSLKTSETEDVYKACITKADDKSLKGIVRCLVYGGGVKDQFSYSTPGHGSSMQPSGAPMGSSMQPSAAPMGSSMHPSVAPMASSMHPSGAPVGSSMHPSVAPMGSSMQPSGVPMGSSMHPSGAPMASSMQPSGAPMASSMHPSGAPMGSSMQPSGVPMGSSMHPSAAPMGSSVHPSAAPMASSMQPSGAPMASSMHPSGAPMGSSMQPSGAPMASSMHPSGYPTGAPFTSSQHQPGSSSVNPTHGIFYTKTSDSLPWECLSGGGVKDQLSYSTPGHGSSMQPSGAPMGKTVSSWMTHPVPMSSGSYGSTPPSKTLPPKK